MARKRKPKTRRTKLGWSERKPRSGLQRRELLEKCGRKSFLDPDKRAYPVMAPPRGRAACTYDCGGVQAAYKRARQQSSIARKAGGPQKFKKEAAYHNKMAKKAHALGRRLGCTWAKRAFGPDK